MISLKLLCLPICVTISLTESAKDETPTNPTRDKDILNMTPINVKMTSCEMTKKA